MKRFQFRSMLWFSLVVILLAAGQYAQAKAPQVSAKYYYTAEVVYKDIQIVDSRLIVVYLPTTFKSNQGASMVRQQAPDYRPSDLKHAEVKLSKSELNEFIRLVKTSGFLKLPNRSGASDRVRYYPTKISVELNGKTKTTEYRSGPGATPMPKAFAEVKNWLLKTAGGKFKYFPAGL